MTYALVGDVGGTNARLALCTVATGEITRRKPILAWSSTAWRR